jgi:hypothetical protein
MDKIFACDVACEICDILSGIKDEEIIDTTVNHISEQMSDMIRTNGLCPAGRLNRLYNIYTFLRDYVDGVHLTPDQKKALLDKVE